MKEGSVKMAARSLIQDPSLHRPPPRGFQCWESVDDEGEVGSVVFLCARPCGPIASNPPPDGKKLPPSLLRFSCRKRSVGVLARDEKAVRDEDIEEAAYEAVDANFFDRATPSRAQLDFRYGPGRDCSLSRSRGHGTSGPTPRTLSGGGIAYSGERGCWSSGLGSALRVRHSPPQARRSYLPTCQHLLRTPPTPTCFSTSMRMLSGFSAEKRHSLAVVRIERSQSGLVQRTPSRSAGAGGAQWHSIGCTQSRSSSLPSSAKGSIS